MDEQEKDEVSELDARITRSIENVGLAGAQAEVVARYGSAAKEHLVAYTGVDQEAGRVLKKGLKQIAQSKVSSANPGQNIKQQAGFAAEVKTVARENAEKIMEGDVGRITSARTVRTDDLPPQKALTMVPEGSMEEQRFRFQEIEVGGTNDPLVDLVEVYDDGSCVMNSARQLKYVGKDAKSCCSKLLSPKYDKYREANVALEIPKELYDGVQAELEQRIESLNRQLQAAEEQGNAALAKSCRAQLDRVQKTKASLTQGKLTSQEAIEARLHPKLSTAKDVARISHRAGLEAAKTGAVIGGGMSFVRNAVAVVKGDETPGEAIKAITVDTAGAGALSYVIGFSGSAIKGGLQNAKSGYLRAISDTAMPAMIATAVLETSKVLYRFFDGEIDGVECLEELGEKGSGIIASAAGATVGQILIPIPIVGGLAGSMLGYALSGLYYNELTGSLREAKMAHEERLLVEAECEAAIAALREYRLEMELAIRNYFTDYIGAFDSALAKMQEAFNTRNVDLLVQSANAITEALGEEALFHTQEELDGLMKDDGTIII